MSQTEILKFLKENKGDWFNHKTLGENLNLSPVTTALQIRRLKNRGYNILTKSKELRKGLCEYYHCYKD